MQLLENGRIDTCQSCETKLGNGVGVYVRKSRVNNVTFSGDDSEWTSFPVPFAPFLLTINQMLSSCLI
jgi:hypothetical protein